MKILLIANYQRNIGGISGQVTLLQKHLIQEKFVADIFSFKCNYLSKLLRFIKLILISRKYEILHIHGCSWFGFLPIILGVIVGKITSKKIIVTYHGGDADKFFAKHPSLVKYFLLKTNNNIVLSGFLGEIFDKYEIPHTIIPNIIEFNTELYKKKIKIYPKIISVRHLNELYNIGSIIKAFEIVKTHIPEASLVIIGDGDQNSMLKKFVINNNIKGITFTGQVSNTEVYRYLTESDIFISAPRIDNFPVSIIEAFNAGVLVISSRVGGVPYIVEENKNGLLFEYNNHEEIAKKIIFAVENSDISLSLIRRAKISVEKYQWNNIKKELIKLYKYAQS